MNATTINFYDTKPSIRLAVLKLRLMERAMPDSEREDIKREMLDLEEMVEKGDVWLDFGDGELS